MKNIAKKLKVVGKTRKKIDNMKSNRADEYTYKLYYTNYDFDDCTTVHYTKFCTVLQYHQMIYSITNQIEHFQIFFLIFLKNNA